MSPHSPYQGHRAAVQDCGIGSNEAQHLGALAMYMPQLVELALPGNQVGKAGVDGLLRPWRLRREAFKAPLKLLDLSGSRLAADGVLPCCCSVPITL